MTIKGIENLYCGHCMSEDVYEIKHFQGEEVEPEGIDGNWGAGIVVQCRDCGDITGWLFAMVGVCPVEGAE